MIIIIIVYYIYIQMSANPKNMITNTFNKVKKGVSSGEGIFILIIVLLLFVLTLIVLSQLKSYPGEKRKKNIKKAENSLKLSTMLGSIGANSKSPLRDYFVKSSFNSCAGGIGQKDWVDLKPLESVIKRGARMLDFQIVSKKGEPHICTSPHTISNEKTALCGTYNTLPFKKVMQFVASNAFGGVDKCPNGEDPLFLNFRVLTPNSNIYPIMADVLKKTFKQMPGGRVINLNNINNDVDLINLPLSSLKRHCFFFCHDLYKGYNNQQVPDIKEIIHLDGIGANGEGSRYLKVWQKGDPQSLELSHDFNSEKHYVKQVGMGLIYPNISRTTKNFTSKKINSYFENGFQFIFMNFQNDDIGLRFYESKFNDVGSGFVLKPPDLRFKEEYVELNPDPSKKVEFKTTPTETVIPGYSPKL